MYALLELASTPGSSIGRSVAGDPGGHADACHVKLSLRRPHPRRLRFTFPSFPPLPCSSSSSPCVGWGQCLLQLLLCRCLSLVSPRTTSGVQECTPVAYVNSTDVPICRHSTGLRAWSSSSPSLIFLQNTRCSTHTYHSRRQKSCWRRTARVEHFTGYSLRHITSYGRLGNI